MEPGAGKSHYFYVEAANTCYNFSPSSNKSADLGKNAVKNNSSKLSEATSEDISLYPIPVKDNLFIKTKQDLRNSTVKIFDMNNRLLFEKSMSINGNASIDISNLLKGVYYTDISDRNSKFHYSKKFVKQ